MQETLQQSVRNEDTDPEMLTTLPLIDASFTQFEFECRAKFVSLYTHLFWQ